MTIKELIKKMKEESDKNIKKSGVYNCGYLALEDWYEKLKGIDITSSGFDYYYHGIRGFIYGLYSASKINHIELFQLETDLQTFLSSEVSA